MAIRFDELFVGGELAHGIWEPELGNARTERSPATPKDYELHLSGMRGLGLMPVRKDGTCRFAAIDIDIDTIDHKDLLRRVRERKMPLTVCRSKSGAAHCYLFMQEPGISAEKIIQILKKWAALLGYPKAEIFPKQSKVSSTNLGNWINLPYFGGDNTTRYAIGPNGALTMDEFFSSIVLWDGREKIDETIQKADLVQISDMPPCLASLTQEGIGAGNRNSGLFNVAVYFRKSSPNGWEDKVSAYNQQYLQPPLNFREIQSIIKSVSQRKYQYTCEQEPICSKCDRQTCLTKPFGVGHEPWKNADDFDELRVSNCRKILTDPPRYIIEVNGNDVELSTRELLKFPFFRDRVFETLDLMVAPQKQNFWEQTIRDLVARKKDIQAPEDASDRGAVMEQVNEFLCLHERATGFEDMLKGVPVLKDDIIHFRVSDLQRFFQNKRIQTLDNNVLYQMLHKAGCTYGPMRVKGKIVNTWRMPVNLLNEQKEDFTPAKFEEFNEEI